MYIPQSKQIIQNDLEEIHMKKVLALVLALILCLSFAACSQTEPESSAPESVPEESAAPSESEAVSEAPAEITTVTAGKLTVATSPDFAPYEFYSVDDAGNLNLSGFDIALAQAIADHLGLELEVVPMDFDSILLELQAGNVDLGIAGFSPDPERAETFDFSDIYYMGGQSLVTLSENKDVYNTYESLTGKSVGAQTGSIQMDLAEQYTPDANIVGLSKVTDIISELLAGKLQAAFIETAVAECYKLNYPELELVMDVEYDVAGSAVALQKGNEALLASVNEVIAGLLADGTMNEYVADANELAAGNIYEGQPADYQA